MSTYLQHHGILGQKWGVRNGPPYPLSGGDYTPSEKKYQTKYNKKSRTLKEGTKIRTLSYNKDRTKDVDMFYAAATAVDKKQYNALFNQKVPQDILDDNGNKIGTGKFYKYRIDNKLVKDTKVADEEAGIEAFKKLYSTNRDFYNYVTDENRMTSLFVKDKLKFKGYQEAWNTIQHIQQNRNYTPSENELASIYRLFNYVIPNENKDTINQRARFFNELKEAGYGAVLDTNDAIYGGYHAQYPIIMFDMENIIPDDISRTPTTSVIWDRYTFLGRKALGI